MGKRNVRISQRDLPQYLDQLTHQTVQVILRDGTTVSGKVIGLKPDQLALETMHRYWYNRGRHRKTIPVEQIWEVILDVVADY